MYRTGSQIKILLTGMLIFLLISCDKDEKEPTFNEEFLSQTKWSGVISFIEDGSPNGSRDFSIVFTTNKRGNYNFVGSPFGNISFNYFTEGKLLNIQGASTASSIMNGDWMLTEINENKVSFREGVASDTDYSILTLTRSE